MHTVGYDEMQQIERKRINRQIRTWKQELNLMTKRGSGAHPEYVREIERTIARLVVRRLELS